MIHAPSDSLWNSIQWSKKDHFCMILFKISAFFLVDSLRSSLMREVKSLKTTNFEHMWATEKKPSYFRLSWLVNRDPYIGLSNSLYNRVASSPIYPQPPRGFSLPMCWCIKVGAPHLVALTTWNTCVAESIMIFSYHSCNTFRTDVWDMSKKWTIFFLKRRLEKCEQPWGLSLMRQIIPYQHDWTNRCKIPRRSLTYPLKSYLPNRKVVFQPPFLRVHVQLRRGTRF